MIKITFWGAAQEVTGSQHLLEVGGTRVLLDCGLYQGHRADTYERNLSFAFKPQTLEGVLLSHAHIDHSGNLPNLVKRGFDGPIYTTAATADLARIMLADSGRIHEHDVHYVNKIRARHGEVPVEPLYTEADALACEHLFAGWGYHQWIPIAPGVRAIFSDAGHILGSALSMIEIKEDSRVTRVLFTGDLGRPDRPILEDPETVPGADYIIMEGTYGDRYHEPMERSRDKLLEAMHHIRRSKGKLLIPAFSVGRTQHIVYSMHKLFLAQELPPMPIYVDSPLSVNATDIFRTHPEAYDREAYQMMLAEGDAFGFQRLTYVRSREESKALNDQRGPMVIISASGMCEGGRILHHLIHSLGERRNLILFSGYQAPHTLGRRILDGEKRVRVFGEPYKVRAQGREISGFSAHADRNGLLQWLEASTGERRPHIFLVHGDPDQLQPLGAELQERGYEVTIPRRGDSFTLDGTGTLKGTGTLE
ncbi:MAG: MBL fold metallo-hydrolase [Chloroflexota bacterium]|nr:MBL fold metallo-hydrolase [Chloroflexota bacterium]